MIRATFTISVISLVFVLNGCGQTAKSKAEAVAATSPCPATEGSKVAETNLQSELLCMETEPHTGLFRMSIPFARAEYSDVNNRPDNIRFQTYVWGYADADFSIQFKTYPKGTFSNLSANERKLRAEALYEKDQGRRGIKIDSSIDVTIDGVPGRQFIYYIGEMKIMTRTFINGDMWYVINASPRTEEVASVMQKLVNSFAFAKP